MGPALLIVLFVAVAAIVGYLNWKAEQARRAALAALAADLGLQFDPADDSDHDDLYAQFEIFRRGHSRVARNTLSGTLEVFGRSCRARCGDYRYRVTSGAGKSRRTRTYRFSYLIVHPPWQTPPLLIRPEGMFDKIVGAFGFDDIDFESVEFSKRFYVKSTDKRFAYDVLHPRMMEFLLAEQPPMIEVEDGALCLSDGSRRWEPDEFRRWLAFLQKFDDLWPRHLVKELES